MRSRPLLFCALAAALALAVPGTGAADGPTPAPAPTVSGTLPVGLTAEKTVLPNGLELILDESLNELEQKLSGLRFFRAHRKELINLDRVKALHAAEGAIEFELDDGQRAQVSRRSVAALKERLGV